MTADFLEHFNFVDDDIRTVLTDKESLSFSIKRGTKQGDPLSSLLLNTVLQYSLENDLKR